MFIEMNVNVLWLHLSGGFPNALAGRGGNQGNSTRQSPFPGMSSMLSSGMSGFPGFPNFNGKYQMHISIPYHEAIFHNFF
jgi:hypothetical protein